MVNNRADIFHTGILWVRPFLWCQGNLSRSRSIIKLYHGLQILPFTIRSVHVVCSDVCRTIVAIHVCEFSRLYHYVLFTFSTTKQHFKTNLVYALTGNNFSFNSYPINRGKFYFCFGIKFCMNTFKRLMPLGYKENFLLEYCSNSDKNLQRFLL